MVNKRTYRTNDGGTAKFISLKGVKKPKRIISLLDSRVSRKWNVLGVLKVKTSEGYFIEQLALKRKNSNTYRIDIGVKSGKNGFDNGHLPSGLLGQTFDADDTPISLDDFNPEIFRLNKLSGQL